MIQSKTHAPSDKKTSMLIGVLFILATAMGILNAGIVGPLISNPDYLVGMSESLGIVMISTLLNIIMAGPVVAIGGTAWLGLASLGNEFVQVGTPDASYYQSLGDILVSVSTSTFTIGAEIVFGVSALILYWVFIKANLALRWISVWGLVGGVLLFTLGVMKTLGVPYGAVEMVLAVWLIVKGFNVTKGN